MRKKRKSEAAKARRGSRGLQPKPETRNRTPEILVSGFETGIWFRFWFGPCLEWFLGHNSEERGRLAREMTKAEREAAMRDKEAARQEAAARQAAAEFEEAAEREAAKAAK